ASERDGDARVARASLSGGRRTYTRRLLNPRRIGRRRRRFVRDSGVAVAGKTAQTPGDQRTQRERAREYREVGEDRQPAALRLRLTLQDVVVRADRARRLRLGRNALRRDRGIGRQVDRRAEQLVLAVDTQERLPLAADRERDVAAVDALAHLVQLVDDQA